MQDLVLHYFTDLQNKYFRFCSTDPLTPWLFSSLLNTPPLPYFKLQQPPHSHFLNLAQRSLFRSKGNNT
jgi:hypothetical protein